MTLNASIFVLLKWWALTAFLCWVYASVAYWKFARLNFSRLTEEERLKYRAFQRIDQDSLTYLSVCIGSIVFMPFRIIIFTILFIVCLASFAAVGVFFVPSGGDLSHSIVATGIVKFLTNVIFPFGLRVFGLVMREHNLGTNPRKLSTRIVVSNHVSMFDVVYLISSLRPGFVTKASLQRVPFLNAACVALGCIFVDRFSSNGREGAVNEIMERQQISGKTTTPLVGFPEGTTTNGINVLPFKRGMFMALKPVTPVVLIYKSAYFCYSYDILPAVWWASLAFASPCMTTLHAYWLPPVAPDAAESDAAAESVEDKRQRADEFAEKVRGAISKALIAHQDDSKPKINLEDVKHWGGSIQDKRECMKRLSNHSNKQSNQMRKKTC